MRVYIAAPYAARRQALAYAQDLRGLGFDVTSSWVNEEHEIGPGTTGAAPALSDDEAGRHAATDLDDVDRADVLVLLTGAALGLAPAECGSGGRHVETGYALAKGKWVVVVGEAENIFHRVGGYDHLVEVVPNWLAAVGFLVEIQGEVL